MQDATEVKTQSDAGSQTSKTTTMTLLDAPPPLRRRSRATTFWDDVVANLRRESTKWLVLTNDVVPGRATRMRQSTLWLRRISRGVHVKTASDDTHIYVRFKVDDRGDL